MSHHNNFYKTLKTSILQKADRNYNSRSKDLGVLHSTIREIVRNFATLLRSERPGNITQYQKFAKGHLNVVLGQYSVNK